MMIFKFSKKSSTSVGVAIRTCEVAGECCNASGMNFSTACVTISWIVAVEHKRHWFQAQNTKIIFICQDPQFFNAQTILKRAGTKEIIHKFLFLLSIQDLIHKHKQKEINISYKKHLKQEKERNNWKEIKTYWFWTDRRKIKQNILHHIVSFFWNINICFVDFTNVASQYGFRNSICFSNRRLGIAMNFHHFDCLQHLVEVNCFF